MPFGLKNSGATFQRMMDNVLVNVTNFKCYVDDVVIHSEMVESCQASKECVFVVAQARTSYTFEEVLVHANSCGTVGALH